MQIKVQQLGKKFHNNWVFKGFDHTFESGKNYAITGANGSGKSTFLKILSGLMIPSSGNITYHNQGRIINNEDWNKNYNYAAPYIDLISEFTVYEQVHFHQQFKSFIHTHTSTSFLEAIELAYCKDTLIKNISSGMKQRLKLGLSLFFKSDILLLDEPTNHLDEKSVLWYQQSLKGLCHDRLCIIASNQSHEYDDFCDVILSFD